jgi:hypothetical protein
MTTKTVPKLSQDKQYDISEEEQLRLKRVISTIGFFTTALNGLQLQLELEKRTIEKRVAVGEDEETVLDMNEMKLFVKKKTVEPKVKVATETNADR